VKQTSKHHISKATNNTTARKNIYVLSVSRCKQDDVVDRVRNYRECL
jgi:hypothetical protein